MGVVEVRAPDGRIWWVKRAWVPRYRGIRQRLALWFAQREPRWWDAPMRWAAGPPRYVETLPRGAAVPLPARREPDGPGPDEGIAGRVVDAVLTMPPDLPGDIGSIGDAAPSASADVAGDAAARLLDVGGGDSAAFDIGGGEAATSFDVGGGDSGGFDLDIGDGGDNPLAALAFVLIVIVATVVAIAVFWFVLLPVLLVFVDGVVLLVAILAAGLVRLLLRRPWDVVAVEDIGRDAQRIRRWEVRGFRRAGRVRDDVIRAIETGTDPDLAVVRVLVSEPRDDDPAGAARSVHEIEGSHPHPAAEAVVPVPGARRRTRRSGPVDGGGGTTVPHEKR